MTDKTKPIEMSFPNNVPGHPHLPPGTYLIDGIGVHGVVNPRKPGERRGSAPEPSDDPESLHPWQRAVLHLHNGEAVEWGPWNWRLYRLRDAHPETARVFAGMQAALLRTGDEYAVTVWRPPANGEEPYVSADYRLALVTWGEYLDMTADEIYNKMNHDNNPKP